MPVIGALKNKNERVLNLGCIKLGRGLSWGGQWKDAPMKGREKRMVLTSKLYCKITAGQSGHNSPGMWGSERKCSSQTGQRRQGTEGWGEGMCRIPWIFGEVWNHVGWVRRWWQRHGLGWHEPVVGPGRAVLLHHSTPSKGSRLGTSRLLCLELLSVSQEERRAGISTNNVE